MDEKYDLKQNLKIYDIFSLSFKAIFNNLEKFALFFVVAMLPLALLIAYYIIRIVSSNSCHFMHYLDESFIVKCMLVIAVIAVIILLYIIFASVKQIYGIVANKKEKSFPSLDKLTALKLLEIFFAGVFFSVASSIIIANYFLASSLVFLISNWIWSPITSIIISLIFIVLTILLILAISLLALCTDLALVRTIGEEKDFLNSFIYCYNLIKDELVEMVQKYALMIGVISLMAIFICFGVLVLLAISMQISNSYFIVCIVATAILLTVTMFFFLVKQTFVTIFYLNLESLKENKIES